MANRPRYLIVFLICLLLVALWLVKIIVIYISAAVILSMLARPLVKAFRAIHIRKFRVPDGLAAFLALSAIVSLLALLISLFIPMLVDEARIISGLDTSQLVSAFHEPLQNLEFDLRKYQIHYGNGESIQQYAITQLKSALNFDVVSGYAEGMIGFTTSFIGATFSILFLSFFFMKDDQMITRFVLMLTPPKHIDSVKDILRDTRRLLTRYFTGVLLDILFVTTLLWIGLSLIGVPNALLIGLFAGLMNIIPYIGPLIGLCFGLLIGVTANLQSDFYLTLLPLLGRICITFLVVQLLDALFFQPLVISNIVKAHPVEIFLVILIAGSFAGISGMIIAVPVYTILRIIAKEFLSNFQIVKKLTGDLEEK